MSKREESDSIIRYIFVMAATGGNPYGQDGYQKRIGLRGWVRAIFTFLPLLTNWVNLAWSLYLLSNKAVCFRPADDSGIDAKRVFLFLQNGCGISNYTQPSSCLPEGVVPFKGTCTVIEDGGNAVLWYYHNGGQAGIISPFVTRMFVWHYLLMIPALFGFLCAKRLLDMKLFLRSLHSGRDDGALMATARSALIWFLTTLFSVFMTSLETAIYWSPMLTYSDHMEHGIFRFDPGCAETDYLQCSAFMKVIGGTIAVVEYWGSVVVGCLAALPVVLNLLYLLIQGMQRVLTGEGVDYYTNGIVGGIYGLGLYLLFAPMVAAAGLVIGYPIRYLFSFSIRNLFVAKLDMIEKLFRFDWFDSGLFSTPTFAISFNFIASFLFVTYDHFKRTFSTLKCLKELPCWSCCSACLKPKFQPARPPAAPASSRSTELPYHAMP